MSFILYPPRISCGRNTTISIDINNNVWSFGNNRDCRAGHLTKNSSSNVIFPPQQIHCLSNIKFVTSGIYHSSCIDYDGNLFTFGSNYSGPLGTGNNSCSIPVKVSNIPPILQVACGEDFTICLSDDGFLYSFGLNNMGQLGLGHYKTKLTPNKIPDIQNVEFISCGGAHAMCKTFDGMFYSWGKNNAKQLGIKKENSYKKPTPRKLWPSTIIDIKCGFTHSIFLTSEGKVYTCGANNYGQQGTGEKMLQSADLMLLENIPEIKRIECGFHHNFLIDYDHNLWVFGWNSFGQLGLGDNKNRYKPLLHPTLTNIMDISHGSNHIFVKTYNGEIYACGWNDYSQLGIDSTGENKKTPIQVFKDNSDIWCSFVGKSRQKSARK